jgi:predicted transcriptional regulator
MIDLIKVIASDRFFEVIDYVKNNPGLNSSTIARALELHIVTIQRSLDTLERYGFVAVELQKKQGRPSKIYRYIGGGYTIDLDALLVEFELRNNRLRETGRQDISFSFDVDKEIVNAILVGGKQGEIVRLDEKMGRFIWFVPPPDSQGDTISALAGKAGISVIDAIRFAEEMRDLGVVEMLP